MIRRLITSGAVFGLCILCQCHKPTGAQGPTERHRSPIDFVLLDQGRRAVVANHTAGSIALVELQTGKVLHETATGRKPAAIALSSDGKRIAVTNHWSHDLTLFTLDGEKLVKQATIPVGILPRGLVFSPSGDHLYVAVAGAD